MFEEQTSSSQFWRVVCALKREKSCAWLISACETSDVWWCLFLHLKRKSNIQDSFNAFPLSYINPLLFTPSDMLSLPSLFTAIDWNTGVGYLWNPQGGVEDGVLRQNKLWNLQLNSETEADKSYFFLLLLSCALLGEETSQGKVVVWSKIEH